MVDWIIRLLINFPFFLWFDQQKSSACATFFFLLVNFFHFIAKDFLFRNHPFRIHLCAFLNHFFFLFQINGNRYILLILSRFYLDLTLFQLEHLSHEPTDVFELSLSSAKRFHQLQGWFFTLLLTYIIDTDINFLVVEIAAHLKYFLSVQADQITIVGRFFQLDLLL